MTRVHRVKNVFGCYILITFITGSYIFFNVTYFHEKKLKYMERNR